MPIRNKEWNRRKGIMRQLICNIMGVSNLNKAQASAFNMAAGEYGFDHSPNQFADWMFDDYEAFYGWHRNNEDLGWWD
jgi:hypothetical protein